MPNDGFLETILKSRDDFDTRRIYADWLEENDDPRGEYLRGLVELAETRSDDSRNRLREQLAKLRPELPARWVRAIDRSQLRLDGLYRTDPTDRSVRFFRFYKRLVFDGCVPPTGTEAQLWRLLHPVCSHVPRGPWVVEMDQLTFSTVSAGRQIDYVGTIHRRRLILNWYSPINDRRGSFLYRFYKYRPDWEKKGTTS